MPKPQFNFSAIPDPDQLPEDKRQKLLAMPWFNQMLDMEEAGVAITPQLAEKLATRPGAQGFRVEEFEIEPGKKAKGLLDVATGEMVEPGKLMFGKDAFQPKLVPLKDPKTGADKGTALTTSPNSAVPFEKPTAKAPMMQDFYQAAPVFDPDMNVLGHVFVGPDGEVKQITKGNDVAGLLGMLGGGAPPAGAPAAPTAASAGPGTPPAAKAPPRQPALRVATKEDYDRVPKGGRYIGPDGKERTKP